MVKMTTMSVDKNVWKETNKRKKFGESLNDVLVRVFDQLNNGIVAYTEPSDEERLLYCMKRFEGGMTPSQIQQSTKWKCEKQRAVCDAAIEAGLIEKKVIPTKTKPRTVYVVVE